MIELNTNPSKKDLKWFGIVIALFFAALGGMAWWQFDSPNTARLLSIVGVVIAAVYYAVPPLRRWMFVGWMVVAFPVGWVLSHVLLAGVYYFVVTPIGLVMRAMGRDPMHRKFDASAVTYWVKHDARNDASRYFRQF